MDMKSETYTIPVLFSDRYKLERTLVMLLNVYGTAWGVPDNTVSVIRSLRKGFESTYRELTYIQLFEHRTATYYVKKCIEAEAHWHNLELELRKLYEEYFLDNVMIPDGYKKLLYIRFFFEVPTDEELWRYRILARLETIVERFKQCLSHLLLGRAGFHNSKRL